jgi:excisionase family DNA binding protein
MANGITETGFDLLTVKEVAEVLHCSKAHVSNAVAGRVHGCSPIPALRVGRRMLVRRESLRQWIERNEAAMVPHRENKSA